MPRFNGMGPEGKGPETGRKLGNCSNTEPRDVNNNERLGLGLRRGCCGRAMGNRGSRCNNGRRCFL